MERDYKILKQVKEFLKLEISLAEAEIKTSDHQRKTDYWTTRRDTLLHVATFIDKREGDINKSDTIGKLMEK